MPVFQLDEQLVFPDPQLANNEGLLAIDGDLSVERLVLAYSNGIFPWYEEDSPILWWSPDPRLIMYPNDLKVSKSLRKEINRGTFSVRFDTNFRKVIENCASSPRDDQDGTWITDEMMEAYCVLYDKGIAHSVETYQDDKLVGGLYGVSLGKAFFGESMFHHVSNASKVAYYHLVEKLKEWEFSFIDAQVHTDHLKSLGAINVSRTFFLQMLKDSQQFPSKIGKWS